MTLPIAVLIAALIAPPQPAPAALASDAVAHLKSQQKAAEHYSYVEDSVHTNGKLVTTIHIEYTFRNGQAIITADAVNGRPKTQAEIDATHAQVEAAKITVKRDEDAGTRLKRGDPADILTPAYNLRLIGPEPVEDRKALLLEAVPAVPITNANAQRSYRLWIDPDTHDVLRLESKVLVDYDAGVMISGGPSPLMTVAGTATVTTFRPVEGVWLAYQTVDDPLYRSKDTGALLTSHIVSTNTSYRLALEP